MTPVNSYEEISNRIGEMLCRGMICNTLPSADALKTEIENNTLFWHSRGGVLAIIRRRKTHDILSYYIKDASAEFNLEFDCDTVVEIPQKPNSDSKEAVEYWKALGFCEILSRIRLTKQRQTEVLSSDYISYAKIEDTEAICKLFSENFPTLTGCLPTEYELENIIKNSELLCRYENDILAGVLHYTLSRPQSEIRHLCVAAAYRRKGIASGLVKDFFAQTEGKKAVVWTGANNESAIAFYKSCGFEPDGYKSSILLFKKG